MNTSPAIKTLAAALALFFGLSLHAAAQNLFVANGNSTILNFNPSGVDTVFASTGQSLPSSLAFDTTGNLYALCETVIYGVPNFTVEKYNSSGAGTLFASSGLDNSRGLVCDSAGNVYVANLGNRTIEKFNSSGVGTVFASGSVFNAVGLNASPEALALDNAGNLYASVEGSILKFNPSGAFTIFASGLGGISSMAFDSVGDLYVDEGTIEKFNQSGVGTFFANAGSGGNSPQVLAVDSADNLYVANYAWNTIEEFNSSGVGTVFASPDGNTGLASPAGLAFQPAPEPSALALLVIGVTALLVRRRARNEMGRTVRFSFLPSTTIASPS